jgi:transposase-like protein
VLEALKGYRAAVEIARAHDLHPTTVARWKRKFLENEAPVFGRYVVLAAY